MKQRALVKRIRAERQANRDELIDWGVKLYGSRYKFNAAMAELLGISRSAVKSWKAVPSSRREAVIAALLKKAGEG